MSGPISLGIDLGTSELKAVLLREDGGVVAHSRAALSVSRPRAGWSEQEPEAWWKACVSALDALKQQAPAPYSSILCIGLSGQMHGAVLLDRSDAVIRPAILWDDSRSVLEADFLAQAFSDSLDVTGSLPMAGLTAPKLLWLKTHEADAFGAVDCVLSPKDYLRFKLTGKRITDMSDAAGTCWLDVRKREWFEPMVQTTGLKLRQLPELVEGTAAAARVTASAARALGLNEGVVVAGGGGDNPASGVGIGAIHVGDAFISLGTSAAVVSVTDGPRGNATTGVHAYCHAVPDRWYAMGAILSGASCLRWAAGVLSQPSELALLDLIEDRIDNSRSVARDAPLFLPYLSGERTPHNDPLIRGGFMNLAHDTTAAMLGYAVLEGVGFALRDALSSVRSAGAQVTSCALVGGGARSEYWAQLLSNILGLELRTLEGSELSASIGAGILGFCALGGVAGLLGKGLSRVRIYLPNTGVREVLEGRYEGFRGLFSAARELAR